MTAIPGCPGESSVGRRVSSAAAPPTDSDEVTFDQEWKVKMSANALVIIALLVVVVGVSIGAWVIMKTPDGANFELSKIRFAAATFTGILLLIVFVSVLYFASPTGPGEKIFGTVVPAVTPIAGAIVGYLFGTKK